MNAKTILAAFSVLAIALAGCSDDPPSGDLSNVRSGLTVDGTADLEYQAGENPYPYAGTELEALFECNPDALSGATGMECSDPYSLVNAHFMSLPMPDSTGYKLVYANSDGATREIGALVDEAGMYTLNATFTEDLSSFEQVDLRMGDVTIASTANTAGSQSFAVNSSMLGVGVTGSWSGKTLEIDVAGLPAVPSGTTFMGWLVSVDADTGEKTHAEQFPIEADGPVTFKANESISKYQEFHIHLGTSMANLVIADL